MVFTAIETAAKKRAAVVDGAAGSTEIHASALLIGIQGEQLPPRLVVGDDPETV